MTEMKDRNIGIFFIILAGLFFALMSLFVRLSGNLPPVQKGFFRNIVALGVALYTLARSNGEKVNIKGNLKDLVIRSLAGTAGILCNFYAVDHLVLADASMLNKMSPFFVIIFSFLILKEKVKPVQWAGVIVAFIGALLVIKPTFANVDLKAYLLGVAGGAAAGTAYTFVRKLGRNGVEGPYVVAFFSGFSCLVMLPFVIADFHPMTIKQFICLMLAGAAAAGGQFSITTAYFHAPAREISVYDYSQIIFSTLIGFIAFKEMPDVISLVGYAIILAAAVWMFKYNKKNTMKQKEA